MTTKSDVKSLLFFVATHKDCPLPPPCDYYVPLGCGGYQSTTTLRAYRDDTGDLIYQKNNHYSELTGWYWIWKNVTDVEHVGLCHYRRYFLLDPNHPLFPVEPKTYLPPSDETFRYLTAPAAKDFAEQILTKFDVIVPKRQRLYDTLSKQYSALHSSEDWSLFIRGIKELHPEYSDATAWFDQMRDIHAYNMMIASKAFFDAYMGSLFAILNWMEQQNPFRTEPLYQCRVPSFIAERYFTFYLHITSCRYFEVPIVLTEPNMF